MGVYINIFYILAWTCAYPCTEHREIEEETTLKSRSLFRWLVTCISLVSYVSPQKIGASGVESDGVMSGIPFPTISLPTPMYFLRLVTGSSGEKVHVGGPGAQVTDAGGRLEGWQPSGRLAGPCGRLVGPDGRPGWQAWGWQKGQPSKRS